MSQGMLGLLPLSKVRGPRNALDERLAGPNGSIWLQRLNHMLRSEMTIVYGDGKTKEELLAEVEKEWDVEPEAREFIRSDQFRMAQEPGECDLARTSQSYAVGTNEALGMLRNCRALPPTEEDALRFAALRPKGIPGTAVFLHESNLWKGTHVLVLEGIYPAHGTVRPKVRCVSSDNPTGEHVHKDWCSWHWHPRAEFIGRKNYEVL